MARKFGEKQIEEFRSIFLQRKNTILKEYMAIRNSEVDFDGDEVDIAQGNLLSSLQEQLSSRAYERLEKCYVALKRIDEGTFGICEECEGRIGKPRLLAMPEADLCISCAEVAEKQSKGFIKK